MNGLTLPLNMLRHSDASHCWDHLAFLKDKNKLSCSMQLSRPGKNNLTT